MRQGTFREILRRIDKQVWDHKCDLIFNKQVWDHKCDLISM